MSDLDRYRPPARGRSRSRSRNRDARPSRYRSRSRSRSRDRQRRSPDRHRRHRRSRSHSRSRSPPPHRPRASPPPPSHRPPPTSDEPPPVGTTIRARVVSVRPFGVFVDLSAAGCRRQGLVHSSQVSEDVRFSRDEDDALKVKALEFFCPLGEEVWVKVTDVRFDGGGRDVKIACSMRAVDQTDGRDLDPQGLLTGPGGGGRGGGGGGGRVSDDPPELNAILRGEVQSVRPFGVFVRLEGFRKYGLVHFSQISEHFSFSPSDGDAERVAAISEVLPVGETGYFKVVEIGYDDRGPKISCSYKLVNQRDGTDLDPGGAKYRPRGEEGGPGGGGFRGQGGIGAAAGAAVAGGAVEWGHLKADVVSYGGTKQYEILPDEDEIAAAAAAAAAARPGPSAPGPSSRGPLPPAAMPSMGRGRGNILPSWMTAGQQGARAPGSAPAGGDPGGPIRSVDDALAVLEAYGMKREGGEREKRTRHKHKREKKSSKKSKKEKKRRKGSKDRRRRRSSSRSSGSTSS